MHLGSPFYHCYFPTISMLFEKLIPGNFSHFECPFLSHA
jgi:hypothetical protein